MIPEAAVGLAMVPALAVYVPLIVANRVSARRLRRYEREHNVKVFYGFFSTGGKR